tara:strand:+ start:1480 stop:1701 length:222 start_codon:yes stop_codon:yes gene_type:complete
LALNNIAKNKKQNNTVQVILFRDASALLALLKIELPLAAIPPMPSPFGLCRRTNITRSRAKKTQIQEKIAVIF